MGPLAVREGMFTNGDVHDVLLILCQADQGDAVDCNNGGDGTAAAHQSTTLPTSIGALSNRAPLTPSEVLAAWRARWVQRYHIPGRGASKD